MKNKLEVGMYCYNKTNRKMGIGKIISFQSNNNVNVRYKNDIELVSIGNLKASHSIIDILEVGDYVNGHRVDKVVIGPKCSYVLLEEVGYYVDTQKDIDDYDIKSIVTKEQFSQMQYEVD